MPWSIQDALDNVLPDGDYLVQVVKVSYSQPKEGAEYGRLNIRLKVVSEGENSGQAVNQGFPLSPDAIGILATFLHGTGEFNAKEKNLPDPEEGEELANFLREALMDKIYEASNESKAAKGSDRKFNNFTIIGPYSADAA